MGLGPPRSAEAQCIRSDNAKTVGQEIVAEGSIDQKPCQGHRSVDVSIFSLLANVSEQLLHHYGNIRGMSGNDESDRTESGEFVRSGVSFDVGRLVLFGPLP